MFNFMFVRKYKNAVLAYIDKTKVDEEAVELQLGKSEEVADNAILYSMRNYDIGIESDSCKQDSIEEEKSNGETGKVELLYSSRRSSCDTNDLDLSQIRYSDRYDNSVVHPMEQDKFESDSFVRYMREHILEKTGETNKTPPVNLTFVQKLLIRIKQSGFTEPRIYKAALMDRRLFSKIISDNNYQPSKDTVLALVFALNLSLADANDLLERAGYSLSHSLKRDVILEYFLKEKEYNLNNINAVLNDLGEKIIGRRQ